jgi:hypothetical protein
MPNGPTPMCRTKCERTVRSASSKNAPRPERCAEPSRKRSATRSPPRKWRSAQHRGRGTCPGKAEAGEHRAPEGRRGAQASPTARVATTVSTICLRRICRNESSQEVGYAWKRVIHGLYRFIGKWKWDGIQIWQSAIPTMSLPCVEQRLLGILYFSDLTLKGTELLVCGALANHPGF